MDKKKYLPKAGGWIMIRTVIPVELPVIDPLSLWFAIPTGTVSLNGDNHIGRAFEFGFEYGYAMKDLGINDRELFKRVMFNFVVNGKSGDFNRKKLEKIVDSCGGPDAWDFEQQVQIKTLFGDVNIQPHEYTVVKDLEPYFEAVKDGHAFMRYMTKSESLSNKLSDQIFYLRSRGIGYADALQLVWQNIKSQNQFYIEFHPAYIDQFMRNWESYFMSKIKYVRERKREDLLNYGKQWSVDEFIAGYNASLKERAA